MNLRLLFLFSAAFGLTVSAAEINPSDRLSAMIKKTLEQKIARAEIELPALDSVMQNLALKDIKSVVQVRLLEDKPNGVALFEVSGEDSQTQVIQTPYTAWIKVPVALRRIYPMEKLKNEDFKVQSVNVASGPAREYRGVLASADLTFSQMESRQTILEGQFVTSSAIQKQPDVRKGDVVKLELNSGELTLTTQAIIQESASIGGKVRVLTVTTKRELVGSLKDDHSVEVAL